MKPYKLFPSEKKIFKDRVSGVEVTQLTSYLGHSHHSYFTNNGWYDNDRRLLFTSDRDNARNLFSIEIESGEISQLTDFTPGMESMPSFTNDVNHVRNEVYYSLGKCLYSLNLDTLEKRKLYEAPEGFNQSMGLVGADGRYVYGTLGEDLSNRIYANLSASYVGMRDIFYAKPASRILQLDVETGKVETLWQEKCWIGHVNPSPAQPELLTFCHEGPWQLVDHRIWCMDVRECKPWKLREREVEGEKIGHEYWHQDGLHVGYQVHRPEGGSRFGVIKYDGTEREEAPCVPFPSPDHIYSNDFNLIVSDSGKAIKLYQRKGTEFDKARVLAMHDGSFFYGSHHPHPRMSADGKSVLYNSNVSGYCQLYIAKIPEDISSLPELEVK